jgi:DNA invertase Pin-like site-specific DNA recombinase
MEHVGMILGIEMSHIARNNKDWHNFLEMCAIFGTILSDEDGVYDPQDTNDRLLLGLKGTISKFKHVNM